MAATLSRSFPIGDLATWLPRLRRMTAAVPPRECRVMQVPRAVSAHSLCGHGVGLPAGRPVEGIPNPYGLDPADHIRAHKAPIEGEPSAGIPRKREGRQGGYG